MGENTEKRDQVRDMVGKAPGTQVTKRRMGQSKILGFKKSLEGLSGGVI